MNLLQNRESDSEMTLKKIQKDTDEWMSQFVAGYWEPHAQFTRLVEEVGELAREINHVYGPKKKKLTEKNKEIGDEIADIMFTLVCIANRLEIDLDDSWNKMMNKLRDRDNYRHERKEENKRKN